MGTISGGGMEPAIESQLDKLAWAWCKENRPNLAKPFRWYADGGIYEKIRDLVAFMKEDEA